MNILVTGANGQLGTEMRLLSPSGGRNRYIFSDITHFPGTETLSLDVTNAEAVELLCESEKVDAIVNCAAYTAVDRAEDEPQMAEVLNSTAAGNLALAMRKRKGLLVHVSTDYVFPGDACQPYAEDAPTAPRGVYGATKLAGERRIEESGCRYLIFRTAWLYSPFGHNFVKTMLGLFATKDSVKVVFDQVGTPTYARDLAGLIVSLLEGGTIDSIAGGLYHYSNEGAVSWYDFAMAVKEMGGEKRSRCRVCPCLSTEYPVKAFRPHFSVLDKSKVKETFSVEIPYWKDSLRDCMARILKNEGP